ncbi:hypothetical protein PVAP13_7KG317792 [Panicum virgatum]|uniref:Uncharacterized protein n=1 Tax=Panicum virgatum TaxID=38727 RepID=A0A8T0QLM3_PANVG|nr:hypothetical protein PVAP13_7KG317792 [Panicum virgatum]
MGAPSDFIRIFSTIQSRVGGRICGIEARREEGMAERRNYQAKGSSLSSRIHQRFLDPNRGLEKASAGLKRRRRDEGGSAEIRPRSWASGRAISKSGEGSVGPDGGEMKAAYWIRKSTMKDCSRSLLFNVTHSFIMF